MDLTGRHFLKLLDYTPEEINYFIDLAAELKRLKKAGIPVDTLRGKNVALIFEKTSTRTRRDVYKRQQLCNKERPTKAPEFHQQNGWGSRVRSVSYTHLVCDGALAAGDIVCTGENGFMAGLAFPAG